MADADSNRSTHTRVCDGCGNQYALTTNNDGSVTKNASRYCSARCRDAKRRRGGLSLKRRAMPTEIKEGSRQCLTCKKTKPIKSFVELPSAKTGYKSICKECESKRVASYHKKRTRVDRQKESRKRAEKAGREYEPRAARPPADLWGRNAKQAFDYWINDRATDEQVAKWWDAVGAPWRNKRLTGAEQYRLQYRLDLEFQVKERMRRQVRKAQKRDGIADVMRCAINSGGASRKVERELGYSIADLMRHIEKQFIKRMTWDKFRAGEIHVDHIIPQASFDLADDDEWRRCWCLSNLRPMWAKDNLAKRDKVLTLC